MTPRVVVTGLGVVSPIGIGVGRFWKSALAGLSGVSAISAFEGLPMDVYRSRVAGQIHDFDATQYVEGPHVERVDRYAQFAMVATKEAVADSGLRLDRENPHRIGTMVGAGMGGMLIAEQEYHRVYQNLRPNRVTPNFIPMVTLNSASGVLAIMCGAKGPNLTISTACSSSAHAIGLALGTIRTGQADIVIVAGADASIVPLTFAGFCTLRALSTNFNDSPEKASRPFSQTRDGFVMGEGAASLIVEELDHARARAAKIYAEVLGYSLNNDAFHMTTPLPSGDSCIRAMRDALADAHVAPQQIDYVNAHASSTQLNDSAETMSIKEVLGEHAKKIPVSGTKGYHAHPLGATGAIEAALCALALDRQWIPPTINYQNPDSACDLDVVPNHGRAAELNYIMSNSFGFGGINACVVMGRVLPQ